MLGQDVNHKGPGTTVICGLTAGWGLKYITFKEQGLVFTVKCEDEDEDGDADDEGKSDDAECYDCGWK